MSKSIVLREGKAFVDVNGDMVHTTDPMLIGLAVLDMLEKTETKQIDFNNLKEKFSAYITEQNHRQTPERYAILQHICSIGSKPFNAKLIFHKMSEVYKVSPGTIYNTFSMLLDANIIEISAKVDQPKIKGVFKTTYFEMKGSNLKMTA